MPIPSRDQVKSILKAHKDDPDAIADAFMALLVEALDAPVTYEVEVVGTIRVDGPRGMEERRDVRVLGGTDLRALHDDVARVYGSFSSTFDEYGRRRAEYGVIRVGVGTIPVDGEMLRDTPSWREHRRLMTYANALREDIARAKRDRMLAAEVRNKRETLLSLGREFLGEDLTVRLDSAAPETVPDLSKALAEVAADVVEYLDSPTARGDAEPFSLYGRSTATWTLASEVIAHHAHVLKAPRIVVAGMVQSVADEVVHGTAVPGLVGALQGLVGWDGLPMLDEVATALARILPTTTEAEAPLRAMLDLPLGDQARMAAATALGSSDGAGA